MLGTQDVIGCIVWAFRRLKSQRVGRWAPAATRFIAFALNFPSTWSYSALHWICHGIGFVSYANIVRKHTRFFTLVAFCEESRTAPLIRPVYSPDDVAHNVTVVWKRVSEVNSNLVIKSYADDRTAERCFGCSGSFLQCCDFWARRSVDSPFGGIRNDERIHCRVCIPRDRRLQVQLVTLHRDSANQTPTECCTTRCRLHYRYTSSNP